MTIVISRRIKLHHLLSFSASVTVKTGGRGLIVSIRRCSQMTWVTLTKEGDSLKPPCTRRIRLKVAWRRASQRWNVKYSTPALHTSFNTADWRRAEIMREPEEWVREASSEMERYEAEKEGGWEQLFSGPLCHCCQICCARVSLFPRSIWECFLWWALSPAKNTVCYLGAVFAERPEDTSQSFVVLRYCDPSVCRSE